MRILDFAIKFLNPIPTKALAYLENRLVKGVYSGYGLSEYYAQVQLVSK